MTVAVPSPASPPRALPASGVAHVRLAAGQGVGHGARRRAAQSVGGSLAGAAGPRPGARRRTSRSSPPFEAERSPPAADLQRGARDAGDVARRARGALRVGAVALAAGGARDDRGGDAARSARPARAGAAPRARGRAPAGPGSRRALGLLGALLGRDQLSSRQARLAWSEPTPSPTSSRSSCRRSSARTAG